MDKNSIPRATIRRLSLYCRHLAEIENQETEYVSSRELGGGIGTNAAQVRKDLSFFDRFGTPGRGYPVSFLRRRLEEILGIDGRRWQVAVIGAGRLGLALIDYGGFVKHGFHVVAVFDSDQKKIGQPVKSLTIEDIANLRAVIKRCKVDIVVIAVPAEFAQMVASKAVDAGIRAVLNFAPATIVLPSEVSLRHVDLAVAMESLSFHLLR